MDAKLHSAVIAVALAAASSVYAQEPAVTPKPVVAAPLAPIALPAPPPAAANKAAAPAPLTAFSVKFHLWRKPHGTFLTRLHARILQADAHGDIAERDRLLRLYEPWAEKYLNEDSTTWSPEKLHPGGTPPTQ
jgi:hypothetical protein